MTFYALPTFYPDIQEPNSNLADVYLAANGSPIGTGVPWMDNLEGLNFYDSNYWYGVAAGVAGALAFRQVRKMMKGRQGYWRCKRYSRVSGEQRCVEKVWAPRTRRNVRI